MENKREISFLYERYAQRKPEIEARVEEFKKIREKRAHEILSELSFCICAANSSAKAAFAAQQKLEQSGLLYSNDISAISQALLESKVRFHNNKAKYIVHAREGLFGKKMLEKFLLEHKNDERELRNRLAQEVMGLGMKEAAHFMRNAGIGFEVAILDRHILKNLLKYGAIKKMPKSLGKKKYLEIEEEMRKFAKKINVPMAHLDLLFWSEEAGHVFK